MRLHHLVIGTLSSLVTAMCLGATEINQATEAELDGVKGLGPASTARILKARDQAPFKDWPDFLRRVKGFKTNAAARLSEAGLMVNGAAFEPSVQAKP
jgi:competence protein ComEA